VGTVVACMCVIASFCFQSLQGTEQAPGFIRRANLFQRLQNLGTLLRTLSCSQSARDMKVLVRYPDIRYHWDKLPS
jgi:hypothetical protein